MFEEEDGRGASFSQMVAADTIRNKGGKELA